MPTEHREEAINIIVDQDTNNRINKTQRICIEFNINSDIDLQNIKVSAVNSNNEKSTKQAENLTDKNKFVSDFQSKDVESEKKLEQDSETESEYAQEPKKSPIITKSLVFSTKSRNVEERKSVSVSILTGLDMKDYTIDTSPVGYAPKPFSTAYYTPKHKPSTLISPKFEPELTQRSKFSSTVPFPHTYKPYITSFKKSGSSYHTPNHDPEPSSNHYQPPRSQFQPQNTSYQPPNLHLQSSNSISSPDYCCSEVSSSLTLEIMPIPSNQHVQMLSTISQLQEIRL